MNAGDVTVADAVALRTKLHAARARLVQRNRAEYPCDPRDVRPVRELEALWDELPADVRADAREAFFDAHPCERLADCPLGRRS